MKNKKVSTPKIKKRLNKMEQVRDKKENSTGFAVTANYTPLNELSVSEIRDLIVSSFWVDNCVNIIADEVSKYPMIAKKEDDTKETEKINNQIKAVNSFLKYPSYKEPLMIIRKKYLKDMLRYGNGGCSIAFSKGKPYYLSVTPGYTIRVTDKEPPTYRFTTVDGGNSLRTIKKSIKNPKTGRVITKEVPIELTLREFMHFQIDADSDRTLARSPIERVYNLILSDKQMAKKLALFTEKGYYMPSFVTVEGANKADVNEFLEFMNDVIDEGAKVFGINKKAVISSIPHWEAKDIISMFKWLGLCIGHTYKVPPFMLNLIEDVGSMNAREQKARFLENVIMPILEYEAHLYTLILAKKAFNTKGVEITSPVLASKLNYDKARMAKLLIAKDESIFTVDEVRKDLFNKEPKKVENEKKEVK